MIVISQIHEHHLAHLFRRSHPWLPDFRPRAAGVDLRPRRHRRRLGGRRVRVRTPSALAHGRRSGRRHAPVRRGIRRRRPLSPSAGQRELDGCPPRIRSLGSHRRSGRRNVLGHSEQPRGRRPLPRLRHRGTDRVRVVRRHRFHAFGDDRPRSRLRLLHNRGRPNIPLGFVRWHHRRRFLQRGDPGSHPLQCRLQHPGHLRPRHHRLGRPRRWTALQSATETFTFTVVPEPSVVGLLALASIGAVLFARRRRQA